MSRASRSFSVSAMTSATLPDPDGNLRQDGATSSTDLTRFVTFRYVLFMAQTAPPNLALQRERFRQQMSRTTLSHHTKLSRKTLLDVELGRTTPRMDTASRIARALDCDVSDLFREVLG